MAFNTEQQKAIDLPLEFDAIIPAAAGSGKTKTLAERVFVLIDNKLIKPSELLVLTFTNNAAHEMKERIIARFSDPNIKTEMASAHIQTFDSFSQYMVKSNAGRLGISDDITVIDESVIEVKKSELLDEILLNYYNDNDKRIRLFESLKKFNMQDDSNTKKILMDINKELDKLTPAAKAKFLDFNEYRNKYLSFNSFKMAYKSIIKNIKDIILLLIYKADFAENYSSFFDEDLDINQINYIFSNPINFRRDYEHLDFENKEYAQAIYEEYLALLKLEDKDLLDALRTFKVDENGKSKKIFSNNPAGFKDCDKDEKERILRPWKIMKEGYSAYLSKFSAIESDIDLAYSKYLEFSSDIEIYLDILKELDNKLFDYKRSVNCYTFADISRMFLRLITEDEYSDILEDLRNRFKYVMVDEYQDANDFQEIFIDAITSPSQKAIAENPQNPSRAHLFCVGDVKQSIYGFRNSNVQIFRRRQALYEGLDSNNGVIAMNKNYRSCPKLIKEINYIFKFYMTEDHGSVNYDNYNETLNYDENVNLYGKDYPEQGIYRITSISGIEDDGYEKGSKEWEALAIINDIKQKVESGFRVYDRSIGGIRECKYGDFCILMRTKSGYKMYQELFSKYDIPLNSELSVNLTEIDAIIVLESLIKMLDHIINRTKIDIKHIFASIARSYLFEYSDQEIFDIVTFKSDKYLEKIFNDKIYLALKDFAYNNKDLPFSIIFNNLIKEFGVIDKLYKIGDVENNISKIESLYQVITTNEHAGDGLSAFIKLFNNMEKYKLDFSTSSLYNTQNAVDMMTIHKSKGLERKIVYMPVSYNKLSTNNMGKADYEFSQEYGILLHSYHHDLADGKETIRSIPELAEKYSDEPDEDINEHVRLFYVALTRAENVIIIVGDRPRTGEETLYDMLDCCPHFDMINEDYIQKMINRGAIDSESYHFYSDAINSIMNAKTPLTEMDFDNINDYRYYKGLCDYLYESILYANIYNLKTELLNQIFLYYKNKLILNDFNDDIEAKIYSVVKRHYCDSFISLFEILSKNIEEDLDDDNDDDNKEEKLIVSNHEELKALIDLEIDKIKAIPDEAPNNKADAKKREKLIELYAPALAYAYDDVKDFIKTSYATSDFKDRNYTFNVKDFPVIENAKIPTLDDLVVTDKSIDFDIKVKRRASKIHETEEVDPAILEVMDYGTYLHRMLELTDFKTKDTSFIKNEKDRALIDEVLKLPIMDLGSDGIAYQEYDYYDELLGTTGSIDLMIYNNGIYNIIDYKTSNIDDPAYNNQLNTYKRNVMDIFNVDKDHVKMYLLSIMQKKFKEVLDEEA
ncbi:MAG: UvrD-helicase domain-containing protein [Acholeplasmatales bacterium]|nr:UvrD-helicase domain-containing protein [Acholeplasmatales bacterium]